MRPGATALAVLVAPLIALPLAAVIGGAVEVVVAADVPSLAGLLEVGVAALVLGYLPALLAVAIVVAPVSRAMTEAGAVGAWSYAAAGVLTALPLLLALPLFTPVLAELTGAGEDAPVFWTVAAAVGCLSAWLAFWIVARPDLDGARA